jgi:hypothetical protein
MKLELDDLDSFESISSQTDNIDTDLPYETILDLKNIEQLAGFDETRAVVLGLTHSGSLQLKTIALP